ncbi:hypothetical protein [Chitinivorax sp. B]|uniref:hypothetical protein n=1 Tax=Chitinivorax sp. B TaxID=2502235 RepID=UPI0010F6A1FB|nr:hypothetical protein [Chitinivorax sp. B]
MKALRNVVTTTLIAAAFGLTALPASASNGEYPVRSQGTDQQTEKQNNVATQAHAQAAQHDAVQYWTKRKPV